MCNHLRISVPNLIERCLSLLLSCSVFAIWSKLPQKCTHSIVHDLSCMCLNLTLRVQMLSKVMQGTGSFLPYGHIYYG